METKAKRLGRRKLAPGEGRTSRVVGWLTEAEAAQVAEQAAAAGVAVSEFTRRAVLGLSVQPRPGLADDCLLMDLNRVGNLLNQIARSLHTDRPERADLAATLDEFRQLVALLVARA